jgi:hypothetical protein
VIQERSLGVASFSKMLGCHALLSNTAPKEFQMDPPVEFWKGFRVLMAAYLDF